MLRKQCQMQDGPSHRGVPIGVSLGKGCPISLPVIYLLTCYLPRWLNRVQFVQCEALGLATRPVFCPSTLRHCLADRLCRALQRLGRDQVSSVSSVGNISF